MTLRLKQEELKKHTKNNKMIMTNTSLHDYTEINNIWWQQKNLDI